jgi:hypothetical protein
MFKKAQIMLDVLVIHPYNTIITLNNSWVLRERGDILADKLAAIDLANCLTRGAFAEVYFVSICISSIGC